MLVFYLTIEQNVWYAPYCKKSSKNGNKLQLLSPQHFKGYVRGQKSDYNDAHAIAEAAQHNARRLVAIKVLNRKTSKMYFICVDF
ncbi:hypothetical protein DTW29_11835 [Vibrio parahaemolyticus]|nr:hypothetical protein [Vibrio parahaemolyticus]